MRPPTHLGWVARKWRFLEVRALFQEEEAESLAFPAAGQPVPLHPAMAAAIQLPVQPGCESNLNTLIQINECKSLTNAGQIKGSYTKQKQQRATCLCVYGTGCVGRLILLRNRLLLAAEV